LSKNVAVFVDVANIFYAAKAAGVDIDYVTLLRSAGAGRDLVRAYAYTGLDPDNENQRNFHDFLRRHGYKVVSKDIRKYGDGKVKANLDIELVVDMMKTARNLDIAIVVSGDGDFAPAIRAVQEMGVRVEVISFRGNTSSDLIEVADQFTDITQLARVEKGTRSGRRVAGDDADLSMTEVPDKQTEGSGTGRGGRTRTGRGRGRSSEAEPAAALASRGRGRVRASTNGSATGAEAEGMVALPGERLAKAGGRFDEADLAAAEVFTLDDMDEGVGGEGTDDGDGDTSGPREEGRRRRRRGGRGRGRGRGRDEAAPAVSERPVMASERFEVEDDEADEPVEPRPRSTPFGSVWDSQLGTPTARLGPIAEDDDDFDEPEIPEYLIAEQRQGGRGRGAGGRGAPRGGPRGGRSAYQSAVARERYGRGGGGGINRYPDVSGRAAPARGPREDRGFGRQGDRPRDVAPRSSSAEPWSEVPPELEAMLRAQVTQRPTARPSGAPADSRESPRDDVAPDAGMAVQAVAEAPAETPVTKRRSTRATTAKTAKATTATTKRRTTRKTTAADATTEDAAAGSVAEGAAEAAAPKRRSTRKAASASGTAETAPADSGETPAAATAPKRRATRKPTAATEQD
jgi:uncharacterized LabA/DUF88 family protein